MFDALNPSMLMAAGSGMATGLPFKDPVLVFSLVLFIILLMPILAARLKLPGIICLILAGVVVGEHGLNLLQRDRSIVLFGTVGLLYIMFLAGLELDLDAFRKQRLRSLGFGALTFFLPLGLGFPVCYWLLGYDGLASLMIASMFSTHTLVAYPIASRLGLTRNEAVAVAVGGTIITDTAVLLLLAVITGAAQGTLNPGFWLRLLVSMMLFALAVLWGFPKIGAWFFRRFEGERTTQFIFVLAMVFLAAFLAQLAGVEPIVGAFAAGLALNRLVPHGSALMYQLEFVGNALFIPFFLIGVGMLVDLSVLMRGPEALIVAGTLIVVAELGKFLAAWASQLLFGYSAAQRNLIFGLSSSHAAATLAVILIGFDLGILDDNALNGTIVLILVTCVVASLVTERAGRRLAVADAGHAPAAGDEAERILVPIANPHTMQKLIDFAVLLKSPEATEPIHHLVVVQDDEEAELRLVQSRHTLDQAQRHARSLNTEVRLRTRIALNLSNGIAHTAKELQITDIVLGWDARVSAFDLLFGSRLSPLLEHSWQTLYFCHLLYPLNTIRRIVALVPDRAEFEIGFGHWLRKLHRLASQTGAGLVFHAPEATRAALARELEALGNRLPLSLTDEVDDVQAFSQGLDPDAMIVILAARRGTVSFQSSMEVLGTKLGRPFQKFNFLIVYPEQSPVLELPKSRGTAALDWSAEGTE